jgi:hypothetical protein
MLPIDHTQRRWLVPDRCLCYAPAVADAPPARRITRDVDPVAVRDLLDQPPRATVAFVDGGSAVVLPARAQVDGDRRLFAVAADAASSLDRREIVLVIDDGPYWFQLRGISVRGIANRVDAPTGAAAAQLAWYAVDARRVLAWDYGAVREE